MNKSKFAKIGVLMASSLIGASAFAFGVELKVEPKVPVFEPKVVAPTISTTIKAPALNMSGMTAAFAVKAPTAKPVNDNKKGVGMEAAFQCNANFPAHVAQVSGLSPDRVNALFAKGMLAADGGCEMGFQEAGDEAIRHAAQTADYADLNGFETAAKDQKPGILGEGLHRAFEVDGQFVPVQTAQAKIMHVVETCRWVAPNFAQEIANDNHNAADYGRTGTSVN